VALIVVAKGYFSAQGNELVDDLECLFVVHALPVVDGLSLISQYHASGALS
jgi:hypothetical protein